MASSVSPDRASYNAAQRASYSAASMDRSSSFLSNVENPILASFRSMSKSTSNVTRVDATKFFQCLRFDPKLMASKHKFNKLCDFRKLASAVFGSPEESLPSGSLKGKLPNPSPEDLKRLKAGLQESTIKARERVKDFSETLSVINKCFPRIPTRKRSRRDALRGGRSKNHAPMGAACGKMGTQSHSLTEAFDFEQQKVEERGKNVIPNKRARTSPVDQTVEVHPNAPVRSSRNSDRVVRLSNSSNPRGEDRSSHIAPDGLETAKLKKKATGIKAYTGPSPNSVSTKVTDGYKEPKQGRPPRHPNSLSRLNDSHRGASTKLHGPARGPRSVASVMPKSPKSPTVVQQVIAFSDLDMVNGTNENTGQSGSSNRKRPPTPLSLSPQVEEWADHRPQKISRTTKKTNLDPAVFPSVKKNKGSGEDVGDGIHRQTRSGRVFGSSGGDAPPVEKILHVGDQKKHRATRQGFDKSGSKSGRLRTRKLSDCKAYTRQNNTTCNAATDFPDHALSGSFWRQMEPVFSSISDADMSFLKQQIQGSIEQIPRNFASETKGKGEISICQRVLAALISEEQEDELSFSETNNRSFDIHESAFDFETDLESDAFNQKMNSTLRSCKDVTFTHNEYANMSLNERLLVEIQSIGLSPKLVPDSPSIGNEDIKERFYSKSSQVNDEQLDAATNNESGKANEKVVERGSVGTQLSPSLNNHENTTEELLDPSHLQLPEMDVLGAKGEDIGSWLNIDNEALLDDDIIGFDIGIGLAIPMDDLSDLDFMIR